MLINTSNTHIPLIFSDFVFNALSHKNPFQIQLISPPNPSRPYQQPVGLKLVCCSSLLQKGLHSYNNHPINTFFSPFIQKRKVYINLSLSVLCQNKTPISYTQKRLQLRIYPSKTGLDLHRSIIA